MMMSDNLYTELQKLTDGMSEQRRSLFEVMKDPEMRMKSVVKICKAAGVSRMCYYGAIADKDFNKAVEISGKIILKASLTRISNALVASAVRGDVKAIELAFKAAGFYDDKAVTQKIQHSGSIENTLSEEEKEFRRLELQQKMKGS